MPFMNRIKRKWIGVNAMVGNNRYVEVVWHMVDMGLMSGLHVYIILK